MENIKAMLYILIEFSFNAPFNSYWKEVIDITGNSKKICRMYFEEGFNGVCIAKELGISPAYVSKVLKGQPNYNKEKEIRSKIRYKAYLERKKTNRKLKTEALKKEEDYGLEYLKHLQWQHSIEMSKRYLA